MLKCFNAWCLQFPVKDKEDFENKSNVAYHKFLNDGYKDDYIGERNRRIKDHNIRDKKVIPVFGGVISRY